MAPPYPVLETARLRLLLPPPDRAPAVVAYFTRNRDHLERWEPARPEGFYDEETWRERLRLNREELRVGRSLRLFLETREGGRIVGSANFTNIRRGVLHGCQLGYALDGEEQGKGLMAEALERALRHVFEELELHRVEANYQPTNERSGRLLRRLGFVVEGYSRDYLFIDGAWRDHVRTALTRPDPFTPPTP